MDSIQVQVRLKADLTDYLSGLVEGSVGHTIGEYGMWSKGSDRFIGVEFPGIGKLDVLWSSLEIIDEEFFKKSEALKKKKLEEYKSATNIIKTIGVRGGFKSLSFEYTDSDGIHHFSGSGFKNDAEEAIAYLQSIGKEVKIEKEK